MPTTERCEAAREIQQIRLYLAALQEIIDELSTPESHALKVSELNGGEPMPAHELLRRCQDRHHVVRQQLTATN